VDRRDRRVTCRMSQAARHPRCRYRDRHRRIRATSNHLRRNPLPSRCSNRQRCRRGRRLPLQSPHLWSRPSPPRRRFSRPRRCRRCRGWNRVEPSPRVVPANAGTTVCGANGIYFFAPAAARIRSATSRGRDTSDRWPASSSTVVAFMRFARNRSSRLLKKGARREVLSVIH
jgi:hypothetical protein